MKKPGSFEGLMDEVYKNLYEKKNTKESKLTKLTKEIILKVKKNQSPVPNREKYALMFKLPVNKSITKTSSKTIFDKMSKIYNETVLQETPSKTKSEISTFLSTTKLLSSPHVTNTTNASISSNQTSKMSSPIKVKMNRVKSQLENLNDKEEPKKKEKIGKSNSMGSINCSINNLNNSRSLRASLDNFRVDLERFLKKDISVNTSAIMSEENEIKKKKGSQIGLKIHNKNISIPNMKSSCNNSNYSTFKKFLSKENIHNIFFTLGKKDRKNMSLKMDSFRTRMELQNL